MAKANIKKCYFGAINSSNGFISFFEDIFFSENIKQRYIIKGGPGTGKSSFMKREAQRARQAGRDVEYYYCSSDTSSIDGIVIDGNIAVFDGTAPHSYDTRLPGAVDKIINLGEYWNSELLIPHANEIAELGKRKNAAYAATYGYLGSAGKLANTADSLILPCIMKEKLEKTAQRMFRTAGENLNARKIIRQCAAFGTKGRVHLDTLFDMAEKHVLIEDYYRTAHFLMSQICKCAIASGYDVHVSFDTLNPSKISELYVPSTGEYFGTLTENTADDVAKVIKMKRFVNLDKLSAVRTQYRKACNVLDSILELAESSLSLAGTLHANIEKYYIISMDFERMRSDQGLSIF